MLPREQSETQAFHRIREVQMSQNAASLADQILMENEEYQRLHQQHADYESRLTTLTEKIVLSDDEQVEEVTLKKKKLHVKDRMEAIARQIRQGAVPH
jgi:hypothetical protein